MPTIGAASSSSSGSALGQLNVKDYGAKCDVKISRTGTVTSASAVLTDTGAAFTQADVGKVLWVNGTVRTIASVQSATQLTMSATSSYSQAGNVPYAYGTDDNAAITAALAALPANGGTVCVPGLSFDSGTHAFTTRTNISLTGVGGRVGVGATKGAGLTGGGYANPASGLIYTGSGTTPYLKLMDCLSVNLRDMGVLYCNTGFTGDLIRFNGSNATTPGMFFTVADCILATPVESVNFVANSLLNLAGAVFVDLENNTYGSAKYQIIGNDPAAATNGAAGFSNAVSVRGGATEFANASVAAVLNPGASWQFQGITFEPINGAKAGAVICSAATQNLQFTGCGFWDALTAGGTWAKLAGIRISFRDCYFEDAGSSDVYLDASTASVNGLIVEGCQFDGYSNPTGQTVLKLPTSGGASFLSALWFKANVFTNGATDPTPSFSGNANVTVAT